MIGILLAANLLFPLLAAAQVQARSVSCDAELSMSNSAIDYQRRGQEAQLESAEANSLLSAVFGLKTLRLSVLNANHNYELKASDVGLSCAVQIAMSEVLTNTKSQESPLNIVYRALGELGRPQCEGLLLSTEDERQRSCLHEARHFLRDFLDAPETRLLLLSSDRDSASQGFPPELGENLAENWVFQLTIPSLSDHLFWIVISRSGRVAPYVYGFN